MRWVFLPGLDGTGLLLEPVVAQGPANTPCTLVRYPCHLKGSYQDYIAAAESSFNSGEPVALIGESFSGPVAITLAAKHSNVKALVLSGSFASSPRARFLRHLLHCLELCLTVNRTSFFFIRLLLAGMDAPEELVQRVARAGHLVPVSVLAHRLGMVLSCDERQTFAGLRIPVLALV